LILEWIETDFLVVPMPLIVEATNTPPMAPVRIALATVRESFSDSETPRLGRTWVNLPWRTVVARRLHR
jgi:hypothetical protein